MIQEIAPRKYFNQYHPDEPREEDFVFLFEDGHVYLKKGESYTIPSFGEMESEVDKRDFIYLFSIDGNKFFLAGSGGVEAARRQPDIYEKLSFRIFRELTPGWLAFAGFTAGHLFRWYNSHRFCGRCGTGMECHETERAMHCPACGNIVYPGIAPAVIVGICNGDSILLTKYANGPYKRNALVAGFAEIGETLEETVQREVLEEVGLRVKNIRYYKNQPWSLSDSLLVGFFADLDGSAEIVLDESELSEACWIKRENVAKPESDISLTAEMIECFRQGNERVQRDNYDI